MDFFNKNFILSNKRFGWIDYDRGISIILVTYRHCYESMEKAGLDMKSHPYLEYINVFFFGFRMPLFFIASGIFISGSMRKRGLGTYAKNRVQTILYPMLVWGVIQITLQILMSGSEHINSDVDPVSYLYLLIWPRTTGQFWYLNALFFVGIIYALLKSFLKFKVGHQLAFGLILYAANAYFNHKGTNIYMGADIFKYYLFFAIGDADLPLDAQSELEQLAAQPVGMGVERLPKQELGAGIDQVDAHGEFKNSVGATTVATGFAAGATSRRRLRRSQLTPPSRSDPHRPTNPPGHTAHVFPDGRRAP